MESFYKPGAIVEVGSPEWKACLINRIQEAKRSVEMLIAEVQVLNEHINFLQVQLDLRGKNG